eukprot:CAMPEP_0206144500 /NCGR_PEP_ID=MMETSP1473-20131121/24271_1 /ASSEMBLY_ACC=CAM_ASM_001109 /TAXON_ID=1461547 /ORGANISM="Stichococcus sp, Strain RCC1054" /LENGTH=933 /DNA_ID=CAMNT_0053540335 /DNA_START=302 /DNA_END=3104 /DNA_ORIENTATION=-
MLQNSPSLQRQVISAEAGACPEANRVEAAQLDAIPRDSLGGDEEDADAWPTDDELDEAEKRWAGSEHAVPAVTALAAALPSDKLEKETKEVPMENGDQPFQKVRDFVLYDNFLPPTGSVQMSYSRLLHLLTEKRVKRITLLSDGKCAIVEVPLGVVMKMDRPFVRDPKTLKLYGEPREEWRMEKSRYYVELPGDMWEIGHFMKLVKEAQPYHDKNGICPPNKRLERFQVYCELNVIDPSNHSEFLNTYAPQFAPIAALMILRGLATAFKYVMDKIPSNRDVLIDLAEELGSHTAKAFNIGVNARNTGVKLEDVAGIDSALEDVKVLLSMLHGDPKWANAGARPYRGVIFDGPPGTGKTYLAKGMATEAGVPFFSANGAEFMQMFAGVATSRVKDLFYAARKAAPSIIFIDEIDAIGLERMPNPFDDPGQTEREKGLMQMMVEMDGFGVEEGDGVLVIGATNRVDTMDAALRRPGRFDKVINIGLPAVEDRFKILKVHSRGKPFTDSHPGGLDSMFRDISKITVGWSGAGLANMINEAAIFMVRRERTDIDMDCMLAAFDKARLGLPKAPMRMTEGKRRIAYQLAARSMAIMAMPAPPIVDHVTMLPHGQALDRVVFLRQETTDRLRNLVNVRKPDGSMYSEFDFACRSLVPLFAARTIEEIIYGKDGISLSTTLAVNKAAKLAYFLVKTTNMYPGLDQSPLVYGLFPGGVKDPTTENLEYFWAPRQWQLLLATKMRAEKFIRARLPIIHEMVETMLADRMERVNGDWIKERLANQVLPFGGDGTDIETKDLLRQFNGDFSRTGESMFRDEISGAPLGGAGACGCVTFNGDWAADVVPLPKVKRAVAGFLDTFDDIDCARMFGGLTKQQVIEKTWQQALDRQGDTTKWALGDDEDAAFPPPPPMLEYINAIALDDERAANWWPPRDVVEMSPQP